MNNKNNAVKIIAIVAVSLMVLSLLVPFAGSLLGLFG